jgi:hypothetical protein
MVSSIFMTSKTVKAGDGPTIFSGTSFSNTTLMDIPFLTDTLALGTIFCLSKQQALNNLDKLYFPKHPKQNSMGP